MPLKEGMDRGWIDTILSMKGINLLLEIPPYSMDCTECLQYIANVLNPGRRAGMFSQNIMLNR